MRLVYRSGGESHGRGMVAMLEGLPKGLVIDLDFIDRQLARRQRGYGRSGRQKIEVDRAEVLAGVRRGASIDAPLVLFIPNRDTSIESMPEPTRPRPGHADLAGCLRHEDRDIRANIERASARETCARVAAGAVAQLLLREFGVEVLGHVVAIGGVPSRDAAAAPGEALRQLDFADARRRVEASPFAFLDQDLEPRLRAVVDAAIGTKDSIGGLVEVVARGVPSGLGSFAQWDQRLDGRLAQALMSVPAFKSVEIGLGALVAERPGSEVHDPIALSGRDIVRTTNHAGGVEGGVSNGEAIVVRAAMKPIATLRRRLASIDLASGEASPAAFERSDVCAVPAASIIAEAMVALVLADALLEYYGGATMEQVRAAHERHRSHLDEIVGTESDPQRGVGAQEP